MALIRRRWLFLIAPFLVFVVVVASRFKASLSGESRGELGIISISAVRPDSRQQNTDGIQQTAANSTQQEIDGSQQTEGLMRAALSRVMHITHTHSSSAELWPLSFDTISLYARDFAVSGGLAKNVRFIVCVVHTQTHAQRRA
jgi:hypothetical protein